MLIQDENIDNARFAACLPLILRQEQKVFGDWSNPKNFDNDRHDPGGKTMNGIIQREYDTYRKAKGETPRDVRKITQDEGTEIYYRGYWIPYCDWIPPGLDLSFFNASVNAGTHEAIKVLQGALEIPVDGEWGPQTEGAMKNLGNTNSEQISAVIARFAERMEAFYRSLNTFQYFGANWIRRTVTIQAQSRNMIQTA